jgi:hypothetical protein
VQAQASFLQNSIDAGLFDELQFKVAHSLVEEPILSNPQVEMAVDLVKFFHAVVHVKTVKQTVLCTVFKTVAVMLYHLAEMANRMSTIFVDSNQSRLPSQSVSYCLNSLNSQSNADRIESE